MSVTRPLQSTVVLYIANYYTQVSCDILKTLKRGSDLLHLILVPSFYDHGTVLRSPRGPYHSSHAACCRQAACRIPGRGRLPLRKWFHSPSFYRLPSAPAAICARRARGRGAVVPCQPPLLFPPGGLVSRPVSPERVSRLAQQSYRLTWDLQDDIPNLT